jgi:hypothetical protein
MARTAGAGAAERGNEVKGKVLVADSKTKRSHFYIHRPFRSLKLPKRSSYLPPAFLVLLIINMTVQIGLITSTR